MPDPICHNTFARKDADNVFLSVVFGGSTVMSLAVTTFALQLWLSMEPVPLEDSTCASIVVVAAPDAPSNIESAPDDALPSEAGPSTASDY